MNNFFSDIKKVYTIIDYDDLRRSFLISNILREVSMIIERYIIKIHKL